MLYGVMIYSTTDGYEDAQIVLADSARLQSTADKGHLQLTLYNGERFRNMQSQGSMSNRANVPYLRETFIKEVDLIKFDANFNMMDASLLSGNAMTKNLKEINQAIDSISAQSDSTARASYRMARETFLARSLSTGYKDSARIVARVNETADFDSLYAHLAPEHRQNAIRTATYRCRSGASEYEFRTLLTNDQNRNLRLHWIEWNKKFTLSVSCIIFFFIGAPLGAIIRKGGLGVPVVVSVGIFLFYYILIASGEKMAKAGSWEIWFGLWLSSFVLMPIGAFITFKANKDSVVFNMEAYIGFFRRLLGLRGARHIARKEVIINDPDYPRIHDELAALAENCRQYAATARLRSVPNYIRLYFHYREDREVIRLSEQMEALIEELSNSRDNGILDALNQLPILSPDAHTRPFHSNRKNIAAGVFIPLGTLFYFRIWRYRVRLWRDMQQIQKYARYINERIEKIQAKK